MDIIMPKKYINTYSFDLWGVIVDAVKLGEKQLEIFQEEAKYKLNEEEISKRISNYRALLNGEPWATKGGIKSKIIDDVETIVKRAGYMKKYSDAFYDDALEVMYDLSKDGNLIVLTSKPADALKKQLPEDISNKLVAIHYGLKSDPNTFVNVFDSEKANGNYIIAHTADELPELEAAVKSNLFRKEGLIYVNRNDKLTKEEVLDVGIGQYVNDLRDAKYRIQ